MFADAFRRRRAIVPADLFYPKDSRSRRYAISRRHGKPLAFAALWESYRRPHGRVSRSYCVITVPANEVVAPFHDRMPLVLEEQNFGVWLGEVPDDPETLLRSSATKILICRAQRRTDR